MDNIQTAENFLKCEETLTLEETTKTKILEKMIEFAKLHVTAALEAASENVVMICNTDAYNYGRDYSTNKSIDFKICDVCDDGDSHYESVDIDIDSILNAYPLYNII